MSRIVDKIRKLIALTTSPSVEEARTAASLAVKLIREHNVELTLPTSPADRPAPPPPSARRNPPPPRQPPPPQPSPPPKDPRTADEASARAAWDAWNGVPKDWGFGGPRTADTAADEAYATWAASNAAHQRAQAGGPSRKPSGSRRIEAKFRGRCRTCGEPYEEGEWVIWTKGKGCRHDNLFCRSERAVPGR